MDAIKSIRKRRWTLRVCCILFFLVGDVAFLPAQSHRAPRTSVAKKKLLIGGLFSLTGNWSTLGQASAAALQLAVEDLNAYFDRVGSKTRVEAIIRDTQLDPSTALRELQDLSASGVRVVLGPQSSAEVEAVKGFAEANDILVLSQSSTAGSLAIAGDNVFRFCPDDDLEGKAIAALMVQDGIRAVVPIWREDPGNIGGHDAVARHFRDLGGTVLDGVGYAPETSDFSAVVSELERQVAEAHNQFGEGQVAIHLAAFDEVVSIFHLANSSGILSSVAWYGSDGVALSYALLNDPVASSLASQVDYPNATFGFDPTASPKWTPLLERIEDVDGLGADPFALAVYDAAWVAAKTVALGENRVDFQFLKRELPDVAGSFFGATGWTALNETGDRRFGNFDFWAIREVDGALRWQVVARYSAASDLVFRYD